jgi:hypothetical protein
MNTDNPRFLKFDWLIAGALLAGSLGLAYGPAKLAGHSVYGGVIQDVTNLFGFYCWDEFSRSELLAGRFPLWNPHNAFGVPHLANMQSAVFYPLNWLKWIFGFWPVIDWLLMLRLWLAGMFTFLFARRALKTGFWSSMLAAAGFMLCGHMTRYVYMSHLNVETLLPMQLFLMHLLTQRQSAGRMIAAGLGFSLLVFGGFPEASLYAITFPLVYFFFAMRFSRKSVILAGAALLIGFILSLPQWLPFAEYLPHAWTYHDPASGLRHADPRLSISLIIPWFFGENYVSPAVPFLTPYLGVISVLLMAYLYVRIKRAAPGAIFFAASALVLLALIHGTPPASWIGKIFPFSLTYNDKYAAPALALSAALAAAAGADLLAGDRRWRGITLVSVVMLLWIAINVVGGYRNWFRPVWALGLLKPAVVAGAVTPVIAALALGIMRSRGFVTRPTMTAGLFLVCLLGLLFDLQGHTPAYHDDLPTRASAIAQTFGPSKGRFRMYADPELKEIFPNRLLPTGVDDLRYYDPLYPRSYVEYMGLINDMEGDALRAHYDSNMIFAVERDRLTHPLLQMANVTLFMLDLPLEQRPLVRAWAKKARTTGPRLESWLRAEQVVCGGELELALMDHPPVKIEGPVIEGNARHLLFEIGLPDRQVFSRGYRGDGVVFTAVGKGPALLFSRYLDPKLRKDDLGWKPFSADLVFRDRESGELLKSREISLILLPGPGDDSVKDAAAFGRLRTRERKAESGLKPAVERQGPVFAYQDENAFPRAWWVKGYSPPVDEDSYMKELDRVAEVNPNTFKKLALPRRDSGIDMKDETVKVESVSTEIAEYSPGRILIESSQEKRGLVVVADQYLPGWTARLSTALETQEAAVIPANGPFMAAPTPAGARTVELSYCPRAFRIGLWAALCSLPLIFFFGAAARFSSKSPEKSEA